MQQIRVGDTYYLKVSVTDKSGNPKNLSNITNILYRMAKSVVSLDYYVDKDITSPDINIDDVQGGVIVVRLTETDTKALNAGTAHHEIQIESNIGDVTTVMCEDIELVGQLIAGTQ